MQTLTGFGLLLYPEFMQMCCLCIVRRRLQPTSVYLVAFGYSIAQSDVAKGYKIIGRKLELAPN